MLKGAYTGSIEEKKITEDFKHFADVIGYVLQKNPRFIPKFDSHKFPELPFMRNPELASCY
jgi:hypothetical protein